MNVLIKLIYIGWESNIERKGTFPINKKQFEENNDLAVTAVAYHWIREIQRKENISKIIEVTYNRDHDITELVGKKLNDLSGDLPF